MSPADRDLRPSGRSSVRKISSKEVSRSRQKLAAPCRKSCALRSYLHGAGPTWPWPGRSGPARPSGEPGPQRQGRSVGKQKPGRLWGAGGNRPDRARLRAARPSCGAKRARLIGPGAARAQNRTPIFPALFLVIAGGAPWAQRRASPLVLCTRRPASCPRRLRRPMLLDQPRVRGRVRRRSLRRGECPATSTTTKPAAAHPRHPGGCCSTRRRRPGLSRSVSDRRRDRNPARPTTHLASLGHRRIGLVVGPRDPSYRRA